MAAAEYSECGTSDSNLCCSICWEPYTEPTLLTCGHTFCRPCLQDLDQRSAERCVVCPECRQVTNLPPEGVCGLKRNVVVQRLVDDVSYEEQMKSYQCSVHEKEEENLFCVECSRRMCVQCMLADRKGHDGHEIVTHQMFKTKQADFIKRRQERKAVIDEQIAKVEARREEIDSALGKVEGDINMAFDHQVALLEKKKDSLLEAVRSCRDDYGSKLDGMVAQYRQLLEDMDGALRHMQILKSKTTMNLDMDSLTILNERSKILDTIFRREVVDDSTLSLTDHADGVRFIAKITENDLLGEIDIPEEKAETEKVAQVTTETVTSWLGVQKAWSFLKNTVVPSFVTRNSMGPSFTHVPGDTERDHSVHGNSDSNLSIKHDHSAQEPNDEFEYHSDLSE